MAILDDPELKRVERSEQRRHEIERIVMHRVSYEEMAKRSLGASWSELTTADRREFVDLFVQLLRDNFANRISERSATEVAY
ncbi:MAG: ABC transporter substrate-binding protein, partial [Nitrospira sp.]